MANMVDNAISGPPIESRQYPMDKRHRGKALIITNYHPYDEDKTFRKACEEDEKNIKNKLENLYFDVEVHSDEEVEEIEEALKTTSRNEEYNKQSDCFVLVVLSHGQQSYENGNAIYKILAKDDYYDEEMLFKYFDGKSCKSLVGKPKIFIIQACRGEKEQTTSMLFDSKGSREGSEVKKKKLYYYLPDNADFFIFRGTSNGTCTFHDPQGTGGYFIQAICKELEDNEKNNYKSDFMTLMTFAIRRVATYEHKPIEQQERDPQQPFITSTLMRLVYLTGKKRSLSGI